MLKIIYCSHINLLKIVQIRKKIIFILNGRNSSDKYSIRHFASQFGWYIWSRDLLSQFVLDRGLTSRFHMNLVWQQILWRLQNLHKSTSHESFNKRKISFTHCFIKVKRACHRCQILLMTWGTHTIFIHPSKTGRIMSCPPSVCLSVR